MDSNAVRRGALAGVLGLMMVVAPAVQLARQDARFGWRMFSFVTPFPAFTVVVADGSERPVDADAHIARRRGDVPFAEALPPFLCELHEDAVAVVVTVETEETTFSCS